MLEPWNNACILPPPVNMFFCESEIDLSQLQHICNNIINILSKQSPLHQESALCSRFLYKYDKKFRNDIGYRNMRKVYTALKKYLAMNLLKDVENFLLALPSEGDEKYLPTRQMLEYIMTRIISFSMIMMRVSVCAKQGAIFYLNRVKKGDSHWMSLLPYSLLCRLWSMAMVLVQHSSTWYSNLYPFLSNLELKGLKFLPEGYILPNDLEEWLDLKNIDNFGRFDWDLKNFIEVDNILEDDEHDLFDNILDFVNQTSKNDSDDDLGDEFKPTKVDKVDTLPEANKITQVSLISKVSCKVIDQGQAISRDSFKIDKGLPLSRESLQKEQGETLSRESFKVLNSQNKVPKVAQNYQEKNKVVKENKQIPNTSKTTKENNEHSHKKVTSTDSLKKFIQNEEKFRSESNNRSLTRHLSLMQWHALKNTLLKMCNTTNRKIDKKFQKVWKDRCLDYM